MPGGWLARWIGLTHPSTERGILCSPQGCTLACQRVQNVGVPALEAVEGSESAGGIALARQRSGKALRRSALFGEVRENGALPAKMLCPGRPKRGARGAREGLAGGGRLTSEQLGLLVGQAPLIVERMQYHKDEMFKGMFDV